MADSDSEDGVPGKSVPVKVLIRIRPLTRAEKELGQKSVWECDRERVWLSASATNWANGVSLEGRNQHFVFDRVFGPSVSTRGIFEQTVNDRVRHVLKGYNATVMAYGQTNSGKTTTIRGDERCGDGLITMCVQQLLSAIKTHEGNPGEWSLKLAYLEIYNETITDLLTGQSGLNLYERREGGVSVDGIREVSAVKWADAMDVLAEGDERRHISATVHNDRSSRAHTVFRVRVSKRSADTPSSAPFFSSELNIVDLAGSERPVAHWRGKDVGQIGRFSPAAASESRQQQESGAINKSLLVLSTVIQKLCEANRQGADAKGAAAPHVPYRSSKITRLLQNSLGGNALSMVICTVTPASGHCQETFNTLRFASRVKLIQTAPVLQQEKLSDAALVRKYAAEIEQLRAGLSGSADFLALQAKCAAAVAAREAAEAEAARLRAETERARAALRAALDEVDVTRQAAAVLIEYTEMDAGGGNGQGIGDASDGDDERYGGDAHDGPGGGDSVGGQGIKSVGGGSLVDGRAVRSVTDVDDNRQVAQNGALNDTIGLDLGEGTRTGTVAQAGALDDVAQRLRRAEAELAKAREEGESVRAGLQAELAAERARASRAAAAEKALRAEVDAAREAARVAQAEAEGALRSKTSAQRREDEVVESSGAANGVSSKAEGKAANEAVHEAVNEAAGQPRSVPVGDGPADSLLEETARLQSELEQARAAQDSAESTTSQVAERQLAAEAEAARLRKELEAALAAAADALRELSAQKTAAAAATAAASASAAMAAAEAAHNERTSGRASVSVLRAQIDKTSLQLSETRKLKGAIERELQQANEELALSRERESLLEEQVGVLRERVETEVLRERVETEVLRERVETEVLAQREATVKAETRAHAVEEALAQAEAAIAVQAGQAEAEMEFLQAEAAVLRVAVEEADEQRVDAEARLRAAVEERVVAEERLLLEAERAANAEEAAEAARAQAAEARTDAVAAKGQAAQAEAEVAEATAAAAEADARAAAAEARTAAAEARAAAAEKAVEYKRASFALERSQATSAAAVVASEKTAVEASAVSSTSHDLADHRCVDAARVEGGAETAVPLRISRSASVPAVVRDRTTGRLLRATPDGGAEYVEFDPLFAENKALAAERDELLAANAALAIEKERMQTLLEAKGLNGSSGAKRTDTNLEGALDSDSEAAAPGLQPGSHSAHEGSEKSPEIADMSSLSSADHAKSSATTASLVKNGPIHQAKSDGNLFQGMLSQLQISMEKCAP